MSVHNRMQPLEMLEKSTCLCVLGSNLFLFLSLFKIIFKTSAL